jgi:hypothetical protein
VYGFKNNQLLLNEASSVPSVLADMYNTDNWFAIGGINGCSPNATTKFCVPPSTISKRGYAYASIGTGLTTQEMVIHNNIVRTFQINMFREVI